MAERIEHFSVLHPCDLCGKKYLKLILFSATKTAMSQYKLWYVCHGCFSYQRIPTTREEPSYGVD